VTLPLRLADAAQNASVSTALLGFYGGVAVAACSMTRAGGGRGGVRLEPVIHGYQATNYAQLDRQSLVALLVHSSVGNSGCGRAGVWPALCLCIADTGRERTDLPRIVKE
jgi:hypothetical protein